MQTGPGLADWLSEKEENMKKIMVLLAVIICAVDAGMASASGYNYEGNRMCSGAVFAEKQIPGKLDGQASPIEIKGDFAPVEKARCNAEAKDYTKIDTKAPPALKSAEKPGDNGRSDSRKGAILGAKIGAGLAGAFAGMGVLAAGAIGSVVAEGTVMAVGAGIAIVGGWAIAGAVAGAAIGYGVGYVGQKFSK